MIKLARGAVFGISALTVAAVLNAALAFGTQLLLVRLFAPQDYGVFVASFATAMLLVPLAGFGLPHFWLKVFSKSQESGRRHLKSAYALMTVMCAISFCLLFFWSYVQPTASDMRAMLQILSVCILGQLAVELLNTKFQLERKIMLLAFITLAQNSLRLALIGIFSLFLGKDITLFHVAISFAASALTIFLSGLFAFRGFAGSHWWINPPTDREPLAAPASISDTAKQSFPFGAALFLQLVYYQSDVVMLTLLSTPAQAGYYNISFALIAATYILPTAVFQRFFLPRIHEWSNENQIKLRHFSFVASLSIGTVGLLVAALFYAASDLIVTLLYGEDYAASAPILRLLSLSIPAIYVSYNFGAILTAQNMKNKTYSMALVALFNITANILVIPTYGAMGAAATTLASAVLLLGLYFLLARKTLSEKNPPSKERMEGDPI